MDNILVASLITTKANVDNDNNNDNDNDNTSSAKVCFRYHLVVGGDNGIAILDTTRIMFCNPKHNDQDDDGMMKITQLFNVVEPSSPKPGNAGLRLLRLVSTFVNGNSREK